MPTQDQKTAVEPVASAKDGPGGGDIKGEIVAPSVFNSTWVRAAALILAVFATARSTVVVRGNLSSFLHILAFGVWLGSSIWVSFIGSLVMFKNMKRQDFGRIQAKLFPKYFAVTTAMVVVLLTTVQHSSLPWLLILALLATSANWLIVEPIASKVLMRRYDLEGSSSDVTDVKDRIKSLHKRFSRLHAISSSLNLASLCSAVGYAWWLGSALGAIAHV